ncbi:MAG: diacylglycerol kinase family protein [Oscillospiraceae bacterium]|jgi:diacylglycerol kinase (ATP)|nr:diacylglycerol kinase family protein [Oscillospiraceae bacterium]
MRRVKGPYSLKKSFSFAFGGVAYALKHERNLRIHFAVMLYVLYFSIRYYDFTNVEYALILLVIGFVITCEMVNTAIEKTVDIETPVYNGLAKIAKDVAAGAVLVSSVTAVAVSLLLFWDLVILSVILADIVDQLLIWGLLLSVTILWIIWPRRNAIMRKFGRD